MQFADHSVELSLCRVALGFGVLDFLAQCGKLSFLIVELFCVALQQRFFFGAAAQARRFPASAEAASETAAAKRGPVYTLRRILSS